MSTNRLIKIEGLAMFVVSIVLYSEFDGLWWVYLVFFLAPDFSMIGYQISTQVGATAYNFVHNYASIAALVLSGFFLETRIMLLAGIIILGHVGLDRLLGFGLKYQSAFKDSHLQRV